MSPSGKDASTAGEHPWEKASGVSVNAVAEAAETEMRAAAADTQVMPAVQRSALADPVAATSGKVEAATETTTRAEAKAETKVTPVATAKPAKDSKVPARPGNRVSKPVIAAAAVAGLVLLSVPLLVMGLSKDNGPTQVQSVPAAFEDDAQAQSGFVPGVAQEQSNPGQVPPPPAPPVGSPNQPQAPAEGGTPPPPPAAGEEPNRVQENPAPPAGPSFTAVTGPGCAAGGFSTPGYYTKGEAGWKTASSGGHAADGCNGSFNSLPMSGDPNKDGDNAAVWRFTTGDVRQGSCQVSVFVPRGGLTRVGGNPSVYTVYRTDQTSNPVGDFRIDQVRQQGGWVDAGRFPVSEGRLTIKLHSRGIDWTNDGPTYARHAAAQIKVACGA
ncbi:hypothetical protein SAMN05421805_12538 [Saccharopolyspora antimicrobica]|uniref:Uncharacterized protein n=1 Tax=Saccharopolyspora antimicrobica TaxID=455193 RepID=A0A1I5K3A9_9PSEU|nr:hypothetical protein [Saccharopolyspora antimicrobica]RKT84778.1 hypothetical protein ATL45_3103 [Saccharopolyspora antimicrobica]SFO79584.1 hypothetical protein SAMN05421805_12538 [Saccharopolyspora antimicrobica]